MATLRLTDDFKEFLKLLAAEKVEHLLIGGYAVGLHGHVRGTKDMDVWVALAPDNLDRLINALVDFGFRRQSLSRELFTGTETVFRMGVPPNRLEVLTHVSGVEFAECYARHEKMEIHGLSVPVIALADLRKNKLSSGRAKNLSDIEALDRREAKNARPATAKRVRRQR